MKHLNLSRFLALLLLAFAGSALAQPPLIYSRSTFNAASFMPAGIPGGAIAQDPYSACSERASDRLRR